MGYVLPQLRWAKITLLPTTYGTNIGTALACGSVNFDAYTQRLTKLTFADFATYLPDSFKIERVDGWHSIAWFSEEPPNFIMHGWADTIRLAAMPWEVTKVHANQEVVPPDPVTVREPRCPTP